MADVGGREVRTPALKPGSISKQPRGIQPAFARFDFRRCLERKHKRHGEFVAALLVVAKTERERPSPASEIAVDRIRVFLQLPFWVFQVGNRL